MYSGHPEASGCLFLLLFNLICPPLPCTLKLKAFLSCWNFHVCVVPVCARRQKQAPDVERTFCCGQFRNLAEDSSKKWRCVHINLCVFFFHPFFSTNSNEAKNRKKWNKRNWFVHFLSFSSASSSRWVSNFFHRFGHRWRWWSRLWCVKSDADDSVCIFFFFLVQNNHFFIFESNKTWRNMCKRLTRGGGHLDTLCSFFLCVKFSFSLIGGTGSQNVISRTWEWKSFFLFFLKKENTFCD